MKLRTDSWLEVFKQIHLLRRHDAAAAAALERKERDVLGRAALSARGLPPAEAAGLICPASPSCGNFSPRLSPNSDGGRPDYSSPSWTPISPSYSPTSSYDSTEPTSPADSSSSPANEPSSAPSGSVAPPSRTATAHGYEGEKSDPVLRPIFPHNIERTDGGLVTGLQISNEGLMQDAAALLRLSGEIYGQMRQLGGQDEVTAYLSDSIGRYERFLFLKAENPSSLLIPTRDIEAVWISHLIRPSEYVRDCQALFRRNPLDHSLRCEHYEAKSWGDALRTTGSLWQTAFGEPYGGYEGYIDDELAAVGMSNRDSWEAKLDAYAASLDQLDVNYGNAASWNWGASQHQLRIDSIPAPPLRFLCCDGLWGACAEDTHRTDRDQWEAACGDDSSGRDVSLPSQCTEQRPNNTVSKARPERSYRISFSATEAMRDIGWYAKFHAWFEDHASTLRSEGRRQASNMPLRWQRGYHRMLFFARSEIERHGSFQLHPPMGVDLFWHAHMLSPAGYHTDCRRLVGCLLAHRPWPQEHADRDVASADGSEFDSGWEKSFGRKPEHDLRKTDVQLSDIELRQMRLAQVGFPAFVLRHYHGDL